MYTFIQAFRHTGSSKRFEIKNHIRIKEIGGKRKFFKTVGPKKCQHKNNLSLKNIIYERYLNHKKNLISL